MTKRLEAEIQKDINEVLELEKELVFNEFSNDIALKLGIHCIQTAKEKGINNIALDITRGEQQLFHFAFEGASANNDEWIKRKVRVVRRYGHSSWYVHLDLEKRGKTIKEAAFLEESEFAPHGGCFPISIKNTGCIGTLTVSGLPQKEDHLFVVHCLSTFLKQKDRIA